MTMVYQRAVSSVIILVRLVPTEHPVHPVMMLILSEGSVRHPRIVFVWTGILNPHQSLRFVNHVIQLASRVQAVAQIPHALLVCRVQIANSQEPHVCARLGFTKLIPTLSCARPVITSAEHAQSLQPIAQVAAHPCSESSQATHVRAWTGIFNHLKQVYAQHATQAARHVIAPHHA